MSLVRVYPIHERACTVQLEKPICLETFQVIEAIHQLLLMLFGYLFYKKEQFFSWPQYWYIAALQQIILLTLAHTTTLWVFFAFYFGLWHSVLSLDKIRAHFKLQSNWQDWSFLLKKAMPFSAMAWIGI